MDQTSHGEETRRQAHEAMKETRAQAAETVRTAAQSGSSFLDNQKRLAAAELDGYACALHETARQLHDQGQDRVADYAHRFAGTLDDFAYNLRERDVRDAVDRITDFARRRPMLFVGGAVAAGFAFTRFLKSTPPGEEESPGVKETVGEIKEKMASGVEQAKEATRHAVEKTKEKVAEGKEKAGETSRREEKRARKHEEPKSATAAEVEIPVILKPHEAEHPQNPPKP